MTVWSAYTLYKMKLWGGFVVSAFDKRQEMYSRYKEQQILHFARISSHS